MIPSLPGFAFSEAPSTEVDFGFYDLTMIFGNLMKGLGFTSYIAQGGDVGSGIVDGLATYFDECKGELCNTTIMRCRHCPEALKRPPIIC